jgi:hypothetical protein
MGYILEIHVTRWKVSLELLNGSASSRLRPTLRGKRSMNPVLVAAAIA